MKLIEICVRNPVKVTVGVLLVVLFGGISLSQMPVALTPRVERPRMSIRAQWPGAGAEEIEREIVSKLEELLNDVPGMTEITSVSRESQAWISMEFSINANMSDALVHIASRLQQIKDYPEDADEPIVYSSDTSRMAVARFNLVVRPPDVIQVEEFQRQFPELAEPLEDVRIAHNPTLARERLAALVKDHPELDRLLPSEVKVHELLLFAKRTIADQFTRIPGVSYVWVWGGQMPEMQVVVDPVALASRQLTISDIRRALRNENKDTPGGDLQEGDEHYVVRTMARYTSPEQVLDEILAVHNGAPVCVRDVATVRLGYKRGRQGSWQLNSPSLSIGVTKTPGANLFEVMKQVKIVRDELNTGVLKKQNVYLYQTVDSTVYVESALGLVKKNILLGGTFTLLALLVFLRSLRTTLVVVIAIPVSIMGTFLMLGLMGRSLNVISLAGMAFAVGMLVDNAVVVLENIFRHHQKGEQPIQAAVQGTAEVWGATLASTLTTMAVFIPILFVREEAGQLFRDIALAISCGVGLSLVVSIVVIPTAACCFIRQPTALSVARKVCAIDLNSVDWFGEKFVQAIVNANSWLMRGTLARLVMVVAFFVGTPFLVYWLMPSIEYLPKGSRNRIGGHIYLPPGYSLDKMKRIGNELHERLRPYAIVNPDSPEADALEYPVISELAYGTYGGRVWLSVRTVDPTRTAELVPLVQDIADDIAVRHPGIESSVNQSGLFERGFNRAARSVDIDIRGPELARLVELGEQVRAQTHKLIPEARVNARPSLNLNAPQIRIVPKKFNAAQMGLTASELGYNVSAFVDGAFATNYIYKGEEIDLTIVAEENVSIRQQDVPIVIPGGQVVPLSSVAEVSIGRGPSQIAHLERSRKVTISVSPPEDMALGDAIDKIERHILQPINQSGELQGVYHIAMSGTADKLRATWTSLRFNLFVVLLITYLLMAALFESWFFPLVIMVSVPLAAVGGLAGLKLMNCFVLQQLDMLTMLGFIILIGTVVNNPILIVHQSLNHMRIDGLAWRDSIITSVQNRIRPIFMTTLTTTFGLLPLVLFPGAGSELYRGVGSVVLGGLLVSTLFTLFLVPALLSLTLEARGSLLTRKPPTVSS